MDEDVRKLDAVVGVHEVELMLLRALLWEVVAVSVDRDRILESFVRSADALAASAPAGTDPEIAVELRARARMYAAAAKERPGTS